MSLNLPPQLSMRKLKVYDFKKISDLIMIETVIVENGLINLLHNLRFEVK